MYRQSPTYFRKGNNKPVSLQRGERRTFPRLQILSWIEYAYGPKTVFITGLAYNNSRGGFLLGSDFPFTPGETLRIRISDPRPTLRKVGELQLIGRICWTRNRAVTSTLPSHEAGVRFDNCISKPTMKCLCTLLHLKH